MSRLIANLILGISVLYLPWWAGVFLGVVFLFMFRSFYEIIFWALIFDLLYAPMTNSFFTIDARITFGALVIFILSVFLKKHIRFYREEQPL